jgi:hypothetical protein
MHLWLLQGIKARENHANKETEERLFARAVLSHSSQLTLALRASKVWFGWRVRKHEPQGATSH